MIKNFKKIAVLFAAAAFMSSCATVSSPVMGLWYTDVKSPAAVTSNANSSKVGTSEASSILGIIATGDASIETAANSAGISKIHHVDVQSTSVLGIFAKYKVFVYGE